MKNLKLLFCLFALLGFVACGDDEDYSGLQNGFEYHAGD